MNFKNRFKAFFKLLIPEIFFIMINAIRNLKNSKFKNKFNNFRSDKLIKLGDELYIIGNSPSISKLDVGVLKGKDVFLCNDFHKHSKFNYIKEYCNVTYFAMDSLKSLQNDIIYRKNLDLKKFILDYYSKIFSEDYITYVPFDLYEYVQINRFFPKCKIEYHEFDEIKNYFKTIVFSKSLDSINLDLALDIRHTPNAMLQNGLLKEYSIINLHGLQHSYVKDRFDSIKVVHHFYQETEETFQNMEHRDLTELFLDSHLTFNVYKELNKLAKLLNVNIYDYTVDGCLDMFEKRKLKN